MLRAAKYAFKGEFNRNVLTLVAGTGIAQLIPLAVTPILARIYDPGQFGIFSLFLAIVSSLSVMGTCRYEAAVILPSKDVDAINLVALAISISVAAFFALLLLMYVLNDSICQNLGNSSISALLYLVPVAVLLNGLYISLNSWSNRNKLYTVMARRRILHSGGTSTVQLGLGVLNSGASGLVIGSISGQAIAAATMANMLWQRDPNCWRAVGYQHMWALAKRYRACIYFLTPAHTLSAVSIQLPAISINFAFGLNASGFFMLADRVINIPLSLISASIGDVFRQRISECYRTGEDCKQQFLSTLRKLCAIATPPLVVLAFFAPPLFATVFGEKWRISGEYCQLMCPMLYLRFIGNPLSLIAIVAQKNRFEFIWQLALTVSLLLVALTQQLLALQIKELIAVFVFIYVFFDIINLLASYRFACAGDISDKQK
jgi:O-antigen/teichoic acid export membrane protein